MRRGLIAPIVLTLLLLACLGQAAPAEEHLRVGLGAFEDGIHSLAAKELWAFTERAPDDPRLEEVYFLLAELETSRKKWKSAAKALSFLVNGKGARATASAYHLAAVQETLGQKKEARENYRLYLNLGGKFNKVQTHWRLAFIERALKNHLRAAEEFDTFLNISKKTDERRVSAWEELVAQLVSAADKKAALDKVSSAVKTSEVKSAAEVLMRLAAKGRALAVELDAPSKEAAFLEIMAANAPDGAAASSYTARRVLALERAGEGKAALALATDYLKGNNARGADALDVLLAAARLEDGGGNHDRALTHFLAALENESLSETDERRTELGLNVFALLLNSGKEELAATQALALLSSGAQLPAAQSGSINSYLGQRAEVAGDRNGALKYYLAVPKSSAHRPDALRAAARLYLEEGQTTAAKPLVDELMLIDSNHDDTRALALALSEAAGDSRQAVALLKEQLAALKEKGGADEAKLLERLAAQLQGAADVAGAQETLNDLAERFPHLPEGQGAAFTLMRKSFDAKQWQRVIDLEKVAEGADRDGARYLAAEALIESGHTELAVGRLEALTASANAGKIAYTGGAHVRLASLDESRGKTDQALLHYEAALNHKLNENLRAFVEKRIAALKGADTTQGQGAQDKMTDEENSGE